MAFPSKKVEAVYNWLTENGSETVAICITNYLSTDSVEEIYDGLVADEYIEDEEESDEEDAEDDEDTYNLLQEIAETMCDCNIGF